MTGRMDSWRTSATAAGVEDLLRGLFAEVLGRDTVHPDDSFFQMGGHSLLATRLVSRVRAAMGVELTVRDFFEAPTPAGLAKRLDRTRTARPPLRPVSRPGRVPLSYAQRRMWFLNQVEGPSPTYNIPVALRLTGALDRPALHAALGDLVARHESLRTRFPAVDGVPHQQVVDAALARPVVAEVVVAEPELAERIDAAARLGFDLAVDLPLRAWLFVLGPEHHVLLLVMHHVVADGWSMEPLRRDLSRCYAARLAGGTPAIDPLPVQYADYSLWQRELVGSDEDPDSLFSRQLSYWDGVLADLPVELNLPTDRPRPRVTAYQGADVEFDLDEDLHRALADLAKDSRVSMFMILHAALAALLTRLGAGTDIPVGTPIAGRTDEALDGLVGFFVNNVVLRTDTAGDPTFRDLLGQVRAVDLAAYENQDVPFDLLVERLNPRRSLARHPLFQVSLVLQSNVNLGLDVPEVTTAFEAVDVSVAKFDLAFFFKERRTEDGRPAGVAAVVEYATELFDARTVRSLVGHLLRLLRAFAAAPDTRIGQVDVLSPRERRQLADWNATERHIPDTTAAALVEAQVARTPAALAVANEGVELTYAELNGAANRLARLLVRGGIGAEDVVALVMPRSVDMVVALLAVLKTGAAYLPVDLGYPADRVAYMLTESGARLVVVADGVDIAVPPGVPRLDLPAVGAPSPADGEPGHDLTDAERSAPVLPAQPAYVIYTSGSTGRPKGVMMHGRSLVNMVRWHAELLPGGTDVRVAQFASFGFDVSVMEILAALICGKAVLVVPDEVRKDAKALVRWLDRNRANELCAPNLVVEALCEAAAADGSTLPHLRDLMQGGEALTLSRRLRAFCEQEPGRRIRNAYGPTETHAVTMHRLPAAVAAWPATPPIGGPLPNCRLRVLDEALMPVPVGVPGELYIAGDQLARGYVRQPALTAERFLPDPLGAPGERMYRSGDIVRWTGAGELEFVGRADRQVKIRGFRVELGEVEAVLAAQPDLARVAVVVREDRPGDRRLAAYVVPEAGRQVIPAELKRRLAARLPDFMVPATIVALDELPLTANDKLDLTRLPEAAPAAAPRAPLTAEEKLLCTLFAEVLQVPEVGPADDFFDLGGHSLLATKLVSRIRAAFDADLQVRGVFDAPTPAGLATLLTGVGNDRPALTPARRPDRLPLSHAQQRMWLLNKLGDLNQAYTLPMAFRVRGPLDGDALALAVGDLFARHEVLRTVLPEVDGVPYQLVRAEVDIRDQLYRTDTTDEELPAALRAAAGRPFDLATDCPLRVHVFRVSPDDHLVLIVLHHVAGDGWSLQPLAQDLATAYGARLGGTPPAWRPLPVQYADYALWQRELLGAEDDPDSLAARQAAFWTAALAGLPDELELPLDRPRSAARTNNGDSVSLTVDTRLHDGLAKLAGDTGTSMFMVLHAALAVVLSRSGAGEDIPIGVPVAGRVDHALDDLVGFFVNTLVLRTDLSGDPTFTRLLDRVRETDLACYAHQDLPFERLVEIIGPARSSTRHPLFQVMLVLQSNEDTAVQLPGLDCRPASVGGDTTKFDLTVSATERTEDGRRAGMDVSIDYRTDLFDERTVRDLGHRFLRMLTAAVNHPSTPVRRIDLLGPAERDLVVRQWNDTARAFPPAGLVDLFQAQVARTPDAPALSLDEERLTYRELNARANRLAWLLIDRRVGPEDVVALALPRSVELIVAMLAVLKAGAAYLPIELDLPVARLDVLMREARPAALLANRTFRVPDGWSDLAIALDDPGTGAVLADLPATDPVDEDRTAPLTPGNPAYVIYTSGSTGRPKGVAVPHAGIANRLRWAPEGYELGPDDRVLQRTPVSFDVSVWEIFAPLTRGARLVLVRPGGHRDPAHLAAVIRREAVTVAHFVPSMLAEFVHAPWVAECTSLRFVACAGEALAGELVDRLRRVLPVPVLNLYGPTEASVEVSWWACEPGRSAADRPVPIGRPGRNTRMYVLDADLQPVPPGVAGELYLAGAQLARGYLGRPDSTADRFVPDPFGEPGNRMYRTGDLARWRHDGQLLFAGRTDDQLKVRGMRLEPGEVVGSLRTHPAVTEAVVTMVGTGTAARLVGYVATRRADLPVAELRAHLLRLLPEYAVPDVFVVLPSLPKLTSGKVDRRALPEPRVHGSDRGQVLGTPLAEALRGLFADVLGVSDVGFTDDFFELGGHSLLANRLVARIRDTLGAGVDLATVFAAPTVRGLTDRLGAGGTSAAFDVLLPLRESGSRAPLYCVHPVIGVGWSYARLLQHVDQDRPVLALQARRIENAGYRPARLEDLAEDYATEILRRQPRGPYHLLGWSMGGVIAHAIASRLSVAGAEVATLVLIDAYPPDPATGWSAGVADQVLRRLLVGVDPVAADALPAKITRAEAIGLLRAAWDEHREVDDRHVAGVVDAALHNAKLVQAFSPARFRGEALLFTATAGAAVGAPTAAAWQPFTAGVEEHRIAATHDTMLRGDAVARIGRVLATRLEGLA